MLEIVDTLREIAVSIDDFSDLPYFKSLAQQGIQSTKKVSWGGLVTPDDVSKEVVSRLEERMQRVLRDPTVIERLKAVGAYPLYEDSKLWNNGSPAIPSSGNKWLLRTSSVYTVDSITKSFGSSCLVGRKNRER